MYMCVCMCMRVCVCVTPWLRTKIGYTYQVLLYAVQCLISIHHRLLPPPPPLSSPSSVNTIAYIVAVTGRSYRRSLR